MTDDDKARRFREVALPHLDAAYNLARWLIRSDDQAQDVVQEAYLRAYRYFDGFRGGDGRAWLLKIVRHSCYDWLQTTGARHETQATDDAALEVLLAGQQASDGPSTDPEALLIRRRDVQRLNTLIEELPTDFREVLILREIQDLSYREIAEAVAVPIGTVMSRLARARALLRAAWFRQPEAADDGL